MGGYGSGMWRDRGAGRCEGHHRIDLTYMNRQKLLTPHHWGTLRWSRGGEETGKISYTVLPDGLRLSYRTRRYGDEDWTSTEEDIRFAWTDTAFGGRRRWFVCPSCWRNCRILYGGTYFRCRRCHRLTYESQYEAPWQRALTRAQNTRVKLGGSGSMDDLFPPKPRGMHWRTYERLKTRDEIYSEYWARMTLLWLRRLR